MKHEGHDILNPSFGSLDTNPMSPSDIAAESSNTVSMVNPNVTKLITAAELRSETRGSDNIPKKPLFVVNGHVYDGTGFLEEHPGGADSIWLAAGDGDCDASEDFLAIHSDAAKLKLANVSWLMSSCLRSGYPPFYLVPRWHPVRLHNLDQPRAGRFNHG